MRPGDHTLASGLDSGVALHEAKRLGRLGLGGRLHGCPVGQGRGRGWVWCRGSSPGKGCTAACSLACELSSPPAGCGCSVLGQPKGPLPAA